MSLKVGDAVIYSDSLGRRGEGELIKFYSDHAHCRVRITRSLECDMKRACWPSKGLIYAHVSELTPLSIGHGGIVPRAVPSTG